MGTFRCGLLLAACLTLAGSTFAQDTNPANPTVPGLPGGPVPAPDTNPPVIAPQTDLSAPIAQPGAEAAPAAAPKTAKPVKKPAAPALPTIRGAAAKLDTLNMALTVDAKGKEETFKITSKTRVFADGKPAILSDAKPGENVIVEYHTNKDKSKDALTLRFGGSAPAAEKGGAAIEKSSGSTKAPAKATTKSPTKKSKKSKKPAPPKKTAEPATGAPVPAPVETIPPGTANPVPPAGVTPLPTPFPTPGGVPGTPGNP